MIAQKKIACLEHPEDLTWHPRVRRTHPAHHPHHPSHPCTPPDSATPCSHPPPLPATHRQHSQLQVIQSYLKGLQFESEPDYDFIAKILELEGPYGNEPYDWERRGLLPRFQASCWLLVLSPLVTSRRCARRSPDGTLCLLLPVFLFSAGPRRCRLAWSAARGRERNTSWGRGAHHKVLLPPSHTTTKTPPSNPLLRRTPLNPRRCFSSHIPAAWGRGRTRQSGCCYRPWRRGCSSSTTSRCERNLETGPEKPDIKQTGHEGPPSLS